MTNMQFEAFADYIHDKRVCGQWSQEDERKAMAMVIEISKMFNPSFDEERFRRRIAQDRN